MFSHIQNNCIAITLIALLTFMGCDSTNSDSEADPPPVSFSSGTIAPGEIFSYTFEEEETVDYYCTIHTPNMTGQITVTSSADATESDTVSMENDQFVPENLEVAPNTEVVWVNNQNHDHTIKTGTPSSSENGDEGPY